VTDTHFHSSAERFLQRFAPVSIGFRSIEQPGIPEGLYQARLEKSTNRREACFLFYYDLYASGQKAPPAVGEGHDDSPARKRE
jgi:hypothetical protein